MECSLKRLFAKWQLIASAPWSSLSNPTVAEATAQDLLMDRHCGVPSDVTSSLWAYQIKPGQQFDLSRFLTEPGRARPLTDQMISLAIFVSTPQSLVRLPLQFPRYRVLRAYCCWCCVRQLGRSGTASQLPMQKRQSTPLVVPHQGVRGIACLSS